MKLIIAIAALVVVVAMASVTQADQPKKYSQGWNILDKYTKEDKFKSVEECENWYVADSKNCKDCCNHFNLLPAVGRADPRVPGYFDCKCVAKE